MHNQSPQSITMKIKSILAITTIGVVLTFTAQADLFDNLDSYTTKSGD